MEIIVIILIFLFYFLPSILGWNKRNAGAILILNLLLGWTLIGWVVALIWSLTNDSPSQQIVYIEKKKEKKKNSEKAYTKEELQKMLDNMKED
jgi:hypothetical protein